MFAFYYGLAFCDGMVAFCTILIVICRRAMREEQGIGTQSIYRQGSAIDSVPTHLPSTFDSTMQ